MTTNHTDHGLSPMLAALRERPDDFTAWGELEEQAASAQTPEPVAELYAEVLARPLSPASAKRLGERAIRFGEEWFADEAPHMQAVLLRVFDLDPADEAIFDRLSMALTAVGNWTSLLDVQAKAVDASDSLERQIQLLDDAVRVAKDVARDDDRAIEFMKRLSHLRPSDLALRASLDRLLERGERWHELIALWDASAQGLGRAEAAALKVQVASCWLDRLKNPPAALDVLRKVLDAHPDHAEGLALTERILSSDDASTPTRREALALLRNTFARTQRPLEAARVLREGIRFAQGEERERLHRDAADLWLGQKVGSEALTDLGNLLALRPDDDQLMEEIGALAEQLGEQARQVSIFEQAAERAATRKRAGQLRLAAATLAHNPVGDGERAIGLCERVFVDDAEPGLALDAGRALDALLEAAGRHETRLPVLERLARLEQDKERRREVLGALAKLAHARGENARAIATWQRRLEEDPQDREALDGLIQLYEAGGDHRALVNVLRRRVPLRDGLEAARDLARIAEVHAESLDELEAALFAWGELHGLGSEFVEAFEVAALLGRAAERDAARSARVVAALGDAYRVLLEDAPRALSYYARALNSDPSLAQARGGLRELLAVDAVRAQAADALAGAYASTDDAEGMLALLPHRLFGAKDEAERARLLRQAAQLEEQRRNDAAQAFAHLRAALIADPAASQGDADLWRLAEQTTGFEALADALREASGKLDPASARAVQLRTQEGELAEHKLGAEERALAAYESAWRANPSDAGLAQAVCRSALKLGKYDLVSELLVASARRFDRTPDELLSLLESQLGDGAAYGVLAAALEESLESAKLNGPIKRELLVRVAEWLERRCEDMPGAERLLGKAYGLGAPHAETLRRLVAVQRRTPGPALFQSLKALAELGEEDLASLAEARELAATVLADSTLEKQVLELTYRRATGLLLAGEQQVAGQDVEQALLASVRRLADLAHASEDARAEVQLLRDASQLPIEAAAASEFAARAARVASDKLADPEFAIALYQRALDHTPQSAEIVAALASQCDKLGRLEELLVLRKRELALTTSVPRRLELRLDLSRVMTEIEARGGRLSALRENLRESPGHEPSLVALERALRERGALADVHELFVSEAAQLEGLGDANRAADLWLSAARIADTELSQADKALLAYHKAQSLRVSDEALEALARIRMARNEPAQAVPWLERHLERLEGEARVGARLKLAHAYQQASELPRALECLAQGIGENPGSFELRDMAAGLYRSSGRMEELAALLAESALLVTDRQAVLSYARQAAELFCGPLAQPGRAIDVLSRAVEADPEDRALKCFYADALTAAGRLEEARSVLDALVQAFGRRRSVERAEVHLRLSRVAQAAGNLEEALAQLDTASSMDRAHTGIMRALGELAYQAGQLDRAERAFRALLMVVKKPQPGMSIDIGVAEVMYQLHLIASAQGQSDKAAELLDSAVQTAVHSQAETARLRQLLVGRNEPALLLKVLELRLAQVQEPNEEAATRAELAEILESIPERKADALEEVLRALGCVPNREALHRKALALAQETGKLSRYVETTRALCERARRKEDAQLVSDLSLRAASTLEHLVGDLAAAEAQYKLVDPSAPGYVEAQFSLARVAGKLGHADEERAVLARIVELPEEPAYAEGRRGARYRLIELLIELPESREQGLSALMRLLEEVPDYARASAILQTACDRDPGDERALELLEQIARKGGDARVLLDFLERHAKSSEPSLGLIREGAELAMRIREHARAEALLRRAIQIAERGEGLVEALWAAIALGRLRNQVGDVKGALDWLERAMQASDPIEAFELGLEIAQLAEQRAKDPARAARIYETLRERDPADRRVWTPLLALYQKAGDLDRTLDLVRSTLEALIDPSERNALRLATANSMFAAGREDDGAALLHDVLSEDPDQEDAALRLADLYERRGENEAMADLLSRKLESARERRSNSIIPLSLRMGSLLEPTRPEAAVEIYREGLALLPESVDLMRATLLVLDPERDAAERAELLERYLTREGRTDEHALGYALWLLDYYTVNADEGAFEQALAIAYRVAPGHVEIRTRLENWYRQREDFPQLVVLLEQEAAREQDPQRSLDLLVEAADIRLHRLSQASEAAALLRKAREFAPTDFELLKRAVLASAASGELGPALLEIDRSLEDGSRSKNERVELLLLRADVAAAAGMHDDAVTALDAAYADGGAPVLEHLVRGLEGARLAAQERSNPKRERELTMRLVALLHRTGETEQAIELLIAWVSRATRDVEAQRVLLELLSGAQRWSEVIGIAESLMALDDPQVLSRVGERLMAAARALGEPAQARGGLERGLARDGEQRRLVQLLAELYQEIGEKRALAELMLRYISTQDAPEKRFEQLRRIGQLLLDAGDTEAALRVLTQASELKPDDVPTVLFIADAHIASKRFQQAQDLLEKTMNVYRQRRSPELAQLRHRMAKLSSAAGDAQARLEWLNSAIEADMNNGDVASELAVVAQNMGDFETALKALRAITMLKTDAPMSRAEAFYRQAVIVAQKGEPRRAVLWAKKAKAENANFPGVDKLLAELGEG